MALTRQQIAQNVQKLKKAGVPDAKIKQYLQSATKELPTKKRKKSVLETTSDIGEKFFLSPLSKFFGIKQATEFVGEQGKRIGTSLAQFDPIVREQISKSPEAFENITGQDISAKKEVGKVAGEALTTAASIAPFATGFAGASVASKLSKPAQIGLKGAGIGATRGAGEALQEGEDFKSVATKAITSGAISGATSFLLSTIAGKASKTFQKKGETLTARALQPSKTRVASDLRKGAESFASKVNREGYKGSIDKIFVKSVANKKSLGTAIGETLKTSKNIVNKSDVVKQFETAFDDEIAVSLLKKSEVNAIKSVIDKIPAKMSVADANRYKILFSEKIPKSAWVQGTSAADSFRAKLFKGISGGFRKEIEKSIPTISTLNEKWAIANDVANVSSNSVANKILSGGLAEEIKHGPLATAVSLITAPGTSVANRTGRAQLYTKLAGFSKNDLIKRITDLLILRSQ